MNCPAIPLRHLHVRLKFLDCMQSALRLKPTFTDAYNNMASALVQKGLIPAALQCYNTALACDPNLVNPATMSCLWQKVMCAG